MNAILSTIDISHFVVDEGSFLGQTIKLGVQYNRLPENTSEALRMYVQVHATMHARRNRAGITIGREEIEQGIFQATVCLELGLIDQSDGDADKAAEIVATGDFEAVRKRGWELAFFRLKEMHEEGELFSKRTEAAFLQDYVALARRWSFTAPETWLCNDPEEEDGPTIVDPQREFWAYEDLTTRLMLMKTLPSDAFKAFRKAADGRGMFDDLLRNLILSLALGIESLVPTVDDVRRFSGLFGEDGLNPDAEASVISQLRVQLLERTDEQPLGRFLSHVKGVIRELKAASSAGFDGCFAMSRT